MNTHKNAYAILILAAALIVSGAIVARAQTGPTQPPASGISGITFPIPELGNCGSKDECKAYCNEPANMDACIAFAKAHGLMTNDEADRAAKFKSELQANGGPGGCGTPDACKAYCSDTAHLEACISFAKSHGLEDANIARGEKILSYLQSGGKMPGNCTSEDSCKAYCSDIDHANECIAFNSVSGAESSSTLQFQKFVALAKAGETPGGCTSRNACEAYCSDASHRDACAAFAEKMGFMGPDQAEKFQASDGKGPGGCDSQSACESYCNDSAHRDECFAFAKDRGLMSDGDIRNAKQGLVAVRAGLSQAPSEVQNCLKATLGPNIIDDIESGKLIPGPDIGEKVRGCFEKFGGREDPQEMLMHAAPQMIACLKGKLGNAFAGFQSGTASATPEMADAFRVCAEEQRLSNGENRPPMDFLRTAPPEVVQCVKNALGDDFAKLQDGEGAQIDESKIKNCFEQFRPTSTMMVLPMMRGGGPGGGDFEGGGVNTGFRRPIPPQALDCLKAALSAADYQELMSGAQPSADVEAKIAACGGTAPSGTQPMPPQGSGNFGPVPDFSHGIPEQVVSCLKQDLTDAEVQNIQAGHPTADEMNALQKCWALSIPRTASGSYPEPGSQNENYAPPAGEPSPPQPSSFNAISHGLLGALLLPFEKVLNFLGK